MCHEFESKGSYLRKLKLGIGDLIARILKLKVKGFSVCFCVRANNIHFKKWTIRLKKNHQKKKIRKRIQTLDLKRSVQRGLILSDWSDSCKKPSRKCNSSLRKGPSSDTEGVRGKCYKEQIFYLELVDSPV